MNSPRNIHYELTINMRKHKRNNAWMNTVEVIVNFQSGERKLISFSTFINSNCVRVN